jgi:hypothetical protein
MSARVDDVQTSIAIAVEPLAVTINEAAVICGLSPSTFRAQFLDTGKVRSIHVAKQVRIVDVQELRDAYRKFVEDKRLV